MPPSKLANTRQLEVAMARCKACAVFSLVIIVIIIFSRSYGGSKAKDELADLDLDPNLLLKSQITFDEIDDVDDSIIAPTYLKIYLNFVPKDMRVCEDLFHDYPFEFSPAYDEGMKAFIWALNKTQRSWEGSSQDISHQVWALHQLARLPFVKTVCETGFNEGWSSFNFLNAKEDVVVHSFDIGQHDCARPMANYLTMLYPKRFFIHWGDSKDTLPAFIEQNPDFKCDVMLVDGGHNYPSAKSEISNFIKLANPLHNFIVFDDYPTDWGWMRKFGMPWELVRQHGLVKEYFRCTFREVVRVQRGFAVGTVVKPY
ncbi:hypothetical protein CAPTEDRAFT_220899 [Capitella teleta]|uniref:Methyltransferase domain-containing protein n=1 Tax=Capitella teleta TaxID=283909 RepID=R7TT58_CAPTE|nr:hypothetical protein CAPTEDRAFT_220899 [Capitella teleta]|eukprot:ELT97083.1 hypothetical protein CAPTEDRAFT_220899 [Capitella teleta]